MPQLHFWCLLVERYFSFGGAPWALFVKILLDQTFFASYLNAAYCMIIELLQRHSLRRAVQKVARPRRPPEPTAATPLLWPARAADSSQHTSRDIERFFKATSRIQTLLFPLWLLQVRSSWWPSLTASWRFWPAAHALTYSVVPLHLRVLWVDVLEVVWVAILAKCVSRAGDSTKQEEA